MVKIHLSNQDLVAGKSSFVRLYFSKKTDVVAPTSYVFFEK